MSKLNAFFNSTVDIPRIKAGKRQTGETLINEELLIVAQYIRDEKPEWIPRIENRYS